MYILILYVCKVLTSNWINKIIDVLLNQTTNMINLLPNIFMYIRKEIDLDFY